MFRLTDGSEWIYVILSGDKSKEISALTVRGAVDEATFRRWMGSILATEHELTPSPTTIEERLGSASPAFHRSLLQLETLWQSAAGSPAAQLKRSLWAKLLKTALGTQFEDDDRLFLEHTYLALAAILVSEAVIGVKAATIQSSPGMAISGQLFESRGIEGAGQAGFFDWVLDAPAGESFVTDLARRVSCFAWQQASHDVLKVLYQSVVDHETRHRLGEYYTPDWLAEHMIDTVVEDPLNQRILDPACGSGTFVFHTVRRFLAASDEAGLTVDQALIQLTDHVFALDLHPVAVILAQATYLIAIGPRRLQERSVTISVPVYLGDSMRWDQDQSGLFSPEGQVSVSTGENGALFSPSLRFPASLVADASRFDQLVAELAGRASAQVSGTNDPGLTGVLERHRVPESDRPLLEETYQVLLALNREGRDHIWGSLSATRSGPPSSRCPPIGSTWS